MSLLGPPLTVTTIICTRDRSEALDRCLESVRAQRPQPLEILVVENVPTDDATRRVAERHGVRYEVEPVSGLSRARNTGARAATGAIVAYIDDDAVAEPGWIEALVRAFDDPKVMAVGGRIEPLVPPGEEGALFARLSGYLFGGDAPLVLDRGDPDWFARVNFGGNWVGTNLAFRRDAFDRWPGFDTRIGPGVVLGNGDENYAVFTLIDLGHRLAYTPHAVVRHPCPTTMADFREKYLRGRTFGAAYMLFLFFAAPHLQGALLRYLFGGALGLRRGWRGQSTSVPGNVLSRRERWTATVAAVPLYLRARRSWSDA